VPADLQKDVPISGEAMDKILTWDWNFMNQKQAEFSESWAKVMR
jgi:putative spermidine/putrescine transport system substrate-binding protein